MFGNRNFHMHWVLLACLPSLQPIRMTAEEGKLDCEVPFQRVEDSQLGWKAEGRRRQIHSSSSVAEDIDSWAAVMDKVGYFLVDREDLSTC